MPALPEHSPGMLLKADTAAVAHWSSALNDPDWQSAAGARCRLSPGKRRVKIKLDCSLAGVEILRSCLGWLALHQNFPSFCREIVMMIRKDCFLGFLASQSRFVYHSGVGDDCVWGWELGKMNIFDLVSLFILLTLSQFFFKTKYLFWLIEWSELFVVAFKIATLVILKKKTKKPEWQ